MSVAKVVCLAYTQQHVWMPNDRISAAQQAWVNVSSALSLMPDTLDVPAGFDDRFTNLCDGSAS